MSRREKIVAALLGLFVLVGLFYFIFSSMKAAPPFPEPDEAGFEDYDFEVEGDTEPLDDLLPAEPPRASTAPAKTPASKPRTR